MIPRALHLTKRSIAEVLYPQGSIVVCRNPECGKPLYRLQRSIYAGEHVEQSTQKYVPVRPQEIVDLTLRSDLEPGQRAFLLAWPIPDRIAHCARIPELKPDSLAECPACKEDFVFGAIRDDQDGVSRFVGGAKGFVIKLAIIPPQGLSRRTA